MSAFLCSDRHISALVTFLRESRAYEYLPRSITMPAATPAQLSVEACMAIVRGDMPPARPESAEVCIRLQELSDQQYGEILFAENVRSLVARYGAEEAMSDAEDGLTYAPATYSAVEVLKLCHCYDYQACETEDYEQSVAHRIVRAIEGTAMKQVPGYEAAPWGI